MSTTTNVPITTTPPSPKFWMAFAATLLASVVAAVCTGVIANPDMLNGLPAWAAAVIVFALPPIAAAAGAYAKRDPLRDAGAEHLALTAAVDGEEPHESTLAGFDAITSQPGAQEAVGVLHPLPEPLEDAIVRLSQRDGGLPDYVRTGIEASGYAVPSPA